MLYEGSVDVSGMTDDEIRALYSPAYGPFDRASMTIRDVLVVDGSDAELALRGRAEIRLAEMRACRDVSSAGSSRRGSHRVKVFAECPQKFAYGSVLKLVPLREPEGRARGALLHLGLMHRYLRMLNGTGSDPLEVMRSAPARIAYTFEDCRRLYEAYDHHYQHEKLDIVAVEKEYAIQVGDYIHTARFDLVLRSNGKTWIYDHKTSSQPAHREIRAWSHELQFLGAELIGRAHFPSYGGVVINAIGTKDLTFSRGKLNIDASLLPAASRSIEWLNGQIQRQFATLADPWNYPRTWACMGRYGRCEFLPLCLHGKQELGQYQTASDSVTDVEA